MIAILLSHTQDDKDSRLILYAGLLAGVQLINTIFYWIYCNLFYGECRFRFTMDRERFKEIFSYAGWNLIGSSADVLKSQGLSLLLNSTFGPIVSAARGIGNKVYVTLSQLNTNFFTATRPQLYKSYAAGEMDDMRKLICQSTRFSYFLLFLVALPLLLETHFILPIWLRGRNVPDEAYLITQLMLIDGMLNCFTSPMAASIQATGKIRNYQLVIGCTLLMIVPLSYIGIKYLGLPPASVFVISIAVTFFTHIERLWFMRRQIGLDIRNYLRTVLVPVITVTVISTALSLLVKVYVTPGEEAKFARHRRVYEAIRKGVTSMGFETVIDPKIESGLVVSVKYPDNPNWDFDKVHDYCYERGFTIYPGKISTTNTFRLCSLGTIDVNDIENFFIVLKEALKHYNIS